MIFVDANVFLRALTWSDVPKVQRQGEIAADLFRQSARGDVQLTTTDAIIAEVAFVLTAKAQYAYPIVDAAAKIGTLLRLSEIKIHEKRVVLHALDFWASYPRLGFPDALAACYAQQHGIDLATFDTDFDDLPDITRWRPASDWPSG